MRAFVYRVHVPVRVCRQRGTGGVLVTAAAAAAVPAREYRRFGVRLGAGALLPKKNIRSEACHVEGEKGLDGEEKT